MRNHTEIFLFLPISFLYTSENSTYTQTVREKKTPTRDSEEKLIITAKVAEFETKARKMKLLLHENLINLSIFLVKIPWQRKLNFPLNSKLRRRKSFHVAVSY